MRTFAEKPKKSERTNSAKPTIASRAHFGQGRDQNPILTLQRTIGNQAVMRMLKNMGNDKGDATADETAHDASLSAAPPIVHEVLNSSGQPLEAQTRAYFEPRFGHDFSRVRVHADAKTAASAKAVAANAYTVGEHIAFAEGQYQPATEQGRALMAHELTHVVQQGEGALSSRLEVGSAEKGVDIVFKAGEMVARQVIESAESAVVPARGTPEQLIREPGLATGLEARTPSAEVPDLTILTVNTAKLNIRAGLYQAALDVILDAVKATKPDLNKCDEIIYDSNYPEDSILNVNYDVIDNKVTNLVLVMLFGKKAFTSVPTLYSCLMHEYRHVLVALRDPREEKEHNHYNDFMAHYWEISHCYETGLHLLPEKMKEVGNELLREYEQLSGFEKVLLLPPYTNTKAIATIRTVTGEADWQPQIEIYERATFLSMAGGSREVEAKAVGQPVSSGKLVPALTVSPTRLSKALAVTTNEMSTKADPLTCINNILTQHRGQYWFLQELPETVTAYPNSRDECRDATLYYNPREPAIALFSPDVATEPPVTWGNPSLGYKTFIVGYPHYQWHIVIGPQAINGSPEEFLAALYHEFVHLQQFKVIREICLRWAESNKRLYDWLVPGLFLPPGMEEIIFRALVPIKEMTADPATLESEPTTRLARESIQAVGANLINYASKEVLARSQTFAEFFHRSLSAAKASILDLVPVHRSTTTAEIMTWSYDDADEDAKRNCIDDIINTLRSAEDVVTFREQVLPGLENYHANQETLTWFLPDLKVGLARLVSVPFVPIYGPAPIP